LELIFGTLFDKTLETVPKPTSLILNGHPLGCEVDISWDFEEKLASNYQMFLFKRSKVDITDEEITNYIQNQTKENVAPGLFVFYDIPNDISEIKDLTVDGGQLYYYRAIVVDRNDNGRYSEIVSANIEVSYFDAKINVVPTKEIVFNIVKKVLKGIAKQTKANIMVYNEFPIKNDEAAYCVVTRSSGENAYRSLSDIKSASGSTLITADVDNDVIQIVWMTNNNPSLRDKLTDIFRGSKRVIKRALRMNQGVLDVNMTVIGDSADEIDGRHMVYGSMLLNVMVENEMVSGNETELMKAIIYQFQFQTTPINDNS